MSTLIFQQIITQAYSAIGRDHPSACESPAVIEKMTNVPLPRIDEESTLVFSGSITNEEMIA